MLSQIIVNNLTVLNMLNILKNLFNFTFSQLIYIRSFKIIVAQLDTVPEIENISHFLINYINLLVTRIQKKNVSYCSLLYLKWYAYK